MFRNQEVALGGSPGQEEQRQIKVGLGGSPGQQEHRQIRYMSYTYDGMSAQEAEHQKRFASYALFHGLYDDLTY